jgi:DNA-binding NtrC family response regulator
MNPLKVLVVDDEVEFVQTLVERLCLRNIDAVGLTSGNEAIDKIRAESFDVVFLDVKMPGIGGLEILKEIKKISPTLKVVLLTGHGSLQDSNEGMRLGAFDYLMKPVKFETLVDLLRASEGKKE